jgi:hypothetical protein
MVDGPEVPTETTEVSSVRCVGLYCCAEHWIILSYTTMEFLNWCKDGTPLQNNTSVEYWAAFNLYDLLIEHSYTVTETKHGVPT